MCRPDDNHDTFIRRFLETPAAAALWPRAFAKIREKRFQICDDFRTYVVPNGLQSDLHNMFVYLTDGTLQVGRSAVPAGAILPPGTRIIIMNWADEARAWTQHRAYLRIPPQHVAFRPVENPDPEDEFRQLCNDITVNHRDDVDTRVIIPNMRIKRPMHISLTHTIRDIRWYRERTDMLIETAERIANSKNSYLTLKSLLKISSSFYPFYTRS
jgi:hypothetical protein